MTNNNFSQPRQQISALALAIAVTLGMLFGVHVLATDTAGEPQMADSISAPAGQDSTAARSQG